MTILKDDRGVVIVVMMAMIRSLLLTIAAAGMTLGQLELKGSSIHKLSKRKDDGFTLVEVLVSMGIFAFTFLALGIGAGTVMRANQVSSLNSTATSMARDKLEELKAVNVVNITSGGPITDTVRGVTFTRAWTVTPNTPVVGVKQIDVTVSWLDYTNHSLTISSGVMG